MTIHQWKQQKWKKQSMALFAWLVVLSLLAGCGGSAEQPTAAPTQAPEATKAPEPTATTAASTAVTETNAATATTATTATTTTATTAVTATNATTATAPVSATQTTTGTSAAPIEITMQPGGSAEKAVEAAKQYKGVTLNVTWEAGLQAQDPLLFSGPAWEKLTGIKINVVEVPFADLYSKAVAEHLAGSGAYDVLNYSPAWTGDLADAGVIEPLDDYINKYMNKGDLDDIAPTYRGLMNWNGKNYGLFDDGDVFIMYYRKDWFGDAKNQADFKAKFNHDLTVPTTWQAWDEVCQFFTEKKITPDTYGCAIQRAEGQAYLWFMDHYRVNGGKFFDDSMKAQINNEAGVKTLTEMVNSNKFMPAGVQKWGFVEILSAWMDGKLGMIVTWPPIGRWSAGYGSGVEQLKWVPPSKVIDKVGYALPPGGHAELAGGFNWASPPTARTKKRPICSSSGCKAQMSAWPVSSCPIRCVTRIA